MFKNIFHHPHNKEIRFFGFFKESPALHFYLLQFVGFAYLFYRFASRSYQVYGQLDQSMFDYGRTFVIELWPIPLFYFTSFQFIYEVFPRPSADVILYIQYVVVACCTLGVLGILPKINAIISFFLALHITGMLQSSNSEFDGGTLALCAMLILCLSPRHCFYSIINGFNITRRHIDYHWPIFLLFLFVGAFYSYSGLNKIIDIGPQWPFTLHIDRLAMSSIEQSLFVANRYAVPFISSLHSSYALSVFGGLVTLIGEIGFIAGIWLPRYRLFFLGSMISLHILVFLMAGINFLGSSFLLLLCMDYNVLVRKANIYYDGNCKFCIRSLNKVKKFDWFNRLNLIPIMELQENDNDLDIDYLQKEMGLKDENGEIYYGADAFEQIFNRCILLIPISLLMKIPGIIYIARYIYGVIARNRIQLGCKID